MIVTTKTPESIDLQEIEDEPRTGSSRQVIDFFAARDRMIAQRNENNLVFGHKQETENFLSRRELLHPLSDPLEEWLQSLITGAALISLLIGILCLPSFTATKTESQKLTPISQTETFLREQNPD